MGNTPDRVDIHTVHTDSEDSHIARKAPVAEDNYIVQTVVVVVVDSHCRQDIADTAGIVGIAAE
jgi:hypothetical protein